MKNKSVQSLLEDIHLVSEQNHEIVQAVRTLVHHTLGPCSEEVKYGGILFTSSIQFGGVFAYKEHVSVEFGSGAKIVDTFGFLEGSGKGRRHLKFRSIAEIAEKKLAEYIVLAELAAKKDGTPH